MEKYLSDFSWFSRDIIIIMEFMLYNNNDYIL